jgi:hypothetical protein
MKFSSAGMLFSVISLSMIAMSGAQRQSDMLYLLGTFNPLTYLEAIIRGAATPSWIAIIFGCNLTALGITVVKFRVNPVWNRY